MNEYEKIIKKVKDIVAKTDNELRTAVQPLLQSGNDKLIGAASYLLEKIHNPVKIFMKGLDSDWTDEEKADMMKRYGSGERDPLSGKESE